MLPALTCLSRTCPPAEARGHRVWNSPSRPALLSSQNDNPQEPEETLPGGSVWARPGHWRHLQPLQQVDGFSCPLSPASSPPATVLGPPRLSSQLPQESWGNVGSWPPTPPTPSTRARPQGAQGLQCVCVLQRRESAGSQGASLPYIPTRGEEGPRRLRPALPFLLGLLLSVCGVRVHLLRLQARWSFKGAPTPQL